MQLLINTHSHVAYVLLALRGLGLRTALVTAFVVPISAGMARPCMGQDRGAVALSGLVGTTIGRGSARLSGFEMRGEASSAFLVGALLRQGNLHRRCKTSLPPICDTDVEDFVTVAATLGYNVVRGPRWEWILRGEAGVGMSSIQGSDDRDFGTATGIAIVGRRGLAGRTSVEATASLSHVAGLTFATALVGLSYGFR